MFDEHHGLCRVLFISFCSNEEVDMFSKLGRLSSRLDARFAISKRFSLWWNDPRHLLIVEPGSSADLKPHSLLRLVFLTSSTDVKAMYVSAKREKRRRERRADSETLD